ncbi:hypothetical protein MPDQ_007534 [Monascus purpureus]|uniref:O-methyltransferase imqG n=1 Tax=Monascus purpureus TaxID=5098 RepID=A0A507R5E0_MONPU|nr:hypothetical protein MPDQ_007534 [Monascus purpureus]BDD58900.1 hypothetical protein MAP00_004141 [Monascus purpureus]
MTSRIQDPIDPAIATQVDAYLDTELTSKGTATSLYDRVLQRIRTNSHAKGLADISVSPSQGKFLALQARLARAKNILEVGTLGAYSTVWFTTASPDTRVTSIEIDENTLSVARENISFADESVSSRISLNLGNALDVLPRLLGEIEAGTRRRFDFVFIDADKQSNLAYFEYAVRMVERGSVIIVDNVVRRGRVVDEAACRDDERIVGVRKVIEAMKGNERVEDAVALQTLGQKGYDGFLLAIVK